MVNAVRIHQHGGPEVLKYEQIEIASPAPHEILIHHTAIGLNFIDTYQRSGLYKVELPFIPGTEGAGIVEAIGNNVKDFKIGDRVCYVERSGGYSEKKVISADRAVKIPNSVSDETAAAVMVKGLTAEYLLFRTYPVKTGDTILIHAAAGAASALLCASGPKDSARRSSARSAAKKKPT
jgi:NADPH2:quinone reductase